MFNPEYEGQPIPLEAHLSKWWIRWARSKSLQGKEGIRETEKLMQEALIEAWAIVLAVAVIASTVLATYKPIDWSNCTGQPILIDGNKAFAEIHWPLLWRIKRKTRHRLRIDTKIAVGE